MTVNEIKINDIISILSTGFKMQINGINENSFDIKSNAPYSNDDEMYISSSIDMEVVKKALIEHTVTITRHDNIIWNNINQFDIKYKKYDLNIPFESFDKMENDVLR